MIGSRKLELRQEFRRACRAIADVPERTRMQYTSDVGPMLQEAGVRMRKRTTSVVFMHRQLGDFEVETAEGVMAGKPGDYLAHDPVSGNVWPVAADYVAKHYVVARSGPKTPRATKAKAAR